MPKYRVHSGPIFWDTDRQVVPVVMETVQLVLSQFKKIVNIVIILWIELNKVYAYQK